MAIRIENQYEGALPKGALEQIESAFDSLPREHTRGIERIRLVPFITDPRIKGARFPQDAGLFLINPADGSAQKLMNGVVDQIAVRRSPVAADECESLGMAPEQRERAYDIIVAVFRQHEFGRHVISVSPRPRDGTGRDNFQLRPPQPWR